MCGGDANQPETLHNKACNIARARQTADDIPPTQSKAGTQQANGGDTFT
jgi:hypothetical protein